MSIKYLFSNLLFPPKCSNCGELLKIEIDKKVYTTLCPSCRIHYENEKQRECAFCGLSMKFCRCMPKNMEKAQCSGLLKLISYRSKDESFPIRQFVYSVKRHDDRAYFGFIAEQMREILIVEMRAEDLNPKDCVITFLPRAPKNKAEHGFDQGMSLAKALSDATGIKMVDCFKRKMFNEEQKSLNQFERRLNMRSAYEKRDVEAYIENKIVILVDDIVTTGASMAACARLAFSLGAYDVIGICIGLTEKEKNIYKNKR